MSQSRVVTVDQLLAQLTDEHYRQKLSALSYIRDHEISDRRIVEYLTTLAQSASDRYIRGKAAEILLVLSDTTDISENEALGETVRLRGSENTAPSFSPIDREQPEARRTGSHEPPKQKIQTFLQQRVGSFIVGFGVGAFVGFEYWGWEYASNPTASMAPYVITAGLVLGGVGLVLGPKVLAWLASLPW